MIFHKHENIEEKKVHHHGYVRDFTLIREYYTSEKSKLQKSCGESIAVIHVYITLVIKT